MNWSFGLDIVEGVADFVLVDLLRRDLARYDLAKQAIISHDGTFLFDFGSLIIAPRATNYMLGVV